MDNDEYDKFKRKKYIKELKQLWLHTRLFRELEDDPTSKDVFATMELISYARYGEAKSNRYHSRKSTYRSGNVEDFLLKQLDTSDSSPVNNREFRIRYRMNRSNFWNLHKKIKNHKVFHHTGHGRKQVKSEYQLLFFLAYLGIEGMGLSSRQAYHQFPSGQGSFDLYKERCVTAILDLQNEAYYWPDCDERKVIAKSFYDDFKVPNVVAVGDGTLFPLAFQPERFDYPDFNGRKGKYTITCMIVNDHMRRIRYYNLGWPGNVHDERVYRHTPLAMYPDRYFSTGEVMLGDSAFSPRVNVVPVYKKKQYETQLPVSKEQFNTVIAKPRVTSEHTIGMLKSRFCMLRSIRIKITADKRSFEKVLKYVRVAIILHNLLIGWDDGEECFDQIDDDVTFQTVVTADNAEPYIQTETGEQRRQQMFFTLRNNGVFEELAMKQAKRRRDEAFINSI